MYRAVVPTQLYTKQKKDYVEGNIKYITHFMPWLSANKLKIYRIVEKDGKISLNCRVCKVKVEGSRKELYDHYVTKHFSENLQFKYHHILREQPYKCEAPNCGYSTGTIF